MIIKRDKFDFEIGYLVKSPCRDCAQRKNLPKCADQCGLINKVRIILARGISCAGRYSTY